LSQAATKFTSVTEISGDEVTKEQIDRAYRRYIWGSQFCLGKDVLEVACGSGFGLGLLARKSNSFRAGDYDPALVAHANKVYGGRIEILELDAENLPFPDHSLDVIMIFEAVYYLDFDRFLDECARLLRPGGRVLISSANKDLFDFNPSPQSTQYLGVVEFGDAFRARGFDMSFYGCSPVSEVGLWQKMLRPVKKWAVSLGMIPKTMTGKKFLKRLVFGGLRTMPEELREEAWQGSMPEPIPAERPDTIHKIIYCEARLRA
jgi:SAM-dependent methyltransferase